MVIVLLRCPSSVRPNPEHLDCRQQGRKRCYGSFTNRRHGCKRLRRAAIFSITDITEDSVSEGSGPISIASSRGVNVAVGGSVVNVSGSREILDASVVPELAAMLDAIARLLEAYREQAPDATGLLNSARAATDEVGQREPRRKLLLARPNGGCFRHQGVGQAGGCRRPTGRSRRQVAPLTKRAAQAAPALGTLRGKGGNLGMRGCPALIPPVSGHPWCGRHVSAIRESRER